MSSPTAPPSIQVDLGSIQALRFYLDVLRQQEAYIDQNGLLALNALNTMLAEWEDRGRTAHGFKATVEARKAFLAFQEAKTKHQRERRGP